MKYSTLCPPKKLLARRATVEAMIEHVGVVERMIASGWITPHNEGGKVDLFSVAEVERAVERYLREDLPALPR